MINLILFIITSLSITNIIGKEYIFNWFRKFIDKYFKYSLINKMINCSTCLGFWVGIGISFIFPQFLPNIWLNMVVCGSISSIINKIIDIKLFTF